MTYFTPTQGLGYLGGILPGLHLNGAVGGGGRPYEVYGTLVGVVMHWPSTQSGSGGLGRQLLLTVDHPFRQNLPEASRSMRSLCRQSVWERSDKQTNNTQWGGTNVLNVR